MHDEPRHELGSHSSFWFRSLGAALLLLASCTAIGPGKGRLENGVYHSPHGNFSLPVPLDSGFGRRFQDDARELQAKEGFVSIFNDFGTLRSVEYGELPAEMQRLEGAALPGALAELYRGYVELKASQLPGTRSLHDEALSDSRGRAHFGVLYIPQGSTLVSGNALNLRGGGRGDTIRAYLLFIEGGFLYDLGACAGFDDATEPDVELTPERIEDYKRVLRDMRESMSFAPAS